MTKINIMLTEAQRPIAMAIVRRIAALPEAHQARAEAIKEEARRQLGELDEEFKALHEATWAELQADMGLDPELNYTVCTDHLDPHGVVFLYEAEEDPSTDQLPANLGAMIAQAVGGRIVSENDGGGVIRIGG